MNNSSSFFANKDCKYYPCHSGGEEINCLFCYCPLYHMENCPGLNEYKEIGGKKVKVCTNCSFPHKPENYDQVVSLLRVR